jgi:hypothetical protein
MHMIDGTAVALSLVKHESFKPPYDLAAARYNAKHSSGTSSRNGIRIL